MLKDERFSYCALCRTPRYTFECCENTSCSGMGCEKCGPKTKLSKQVEKRIVLGDLPQPVLDEQAAWEALSPRARKEKLRASMDKIFGS